MSVADVNDVSGSRSESKGERLEGEQGAGEGKESCACSGPLFSESDLSKCRGTTGIRSGSCLIRLFCTDTITQVFTNIHRSSCDSLYAR